MTDRQICFVRDVGRTENLQPLNPRNPQVYRACRVYRV